LWLPTKHIDKEVYLEQDEFNRINYGVPTRTNLWKSSILINQLFTMQDDTRGSLCGGSREPAMFPLWSYSPAMNIFTLDGHWAPAREATSWPTRHPTPLWPPSAPSVGGRCTLAARWNPKCWRASWKPLGMPGMKHQRQGAYWFRFGGARRGSGLLCTSAIGSCEYASPTDGIDHRIFMLDADHGHVTCRVGDSEEQVLREAPAHTFGRLGKEW